jgi:amino acid adenylation domain-containing protein
VTRNAEFRNLISGFCESVDRFPSNPALVVEGQSFTYLDLYRTANRIASAIIQREQEPCPLVGLLAHRSMTAYGSILGALAAGKGYVPLNPKLPVERTRSMLLLSGVSVLIVGRRGFAQLPQLLRGVDRRLTIILPDAVDTGDLPARFQQHLFVSSADIPDRGNVSFEHGTRPADIAYLLFTSGSTGEPKGVPISQSNVCSYLRHVCERYDLNEHDRFSQGFDLTFDLSVHDLFVCWGHGGCLFALPESVLASASFIRKHRLTAWFSVPSVIGVLAKVGLLQPNCFPSLRHSFFCGEPLPASYAQLWQQAAPNSVVENLYGPTETTIAIAYYRWDQGRSPQECLNGIVPLGQIFQRQRCRILDHNRNIVRTGDHGELCLSGSQVSPGYWNNPDKTAEQFIRLKGEEEDRWYCTGDLVKQDETGCLHYLGRIDHQVKLRGYRVELQEIEAVLRRACATEEVVSVPWPVRDGNAVGVTAFISGVKDLNRNNVLTYCRKFLPDYMVPREIHVLDLMPLNMNGKVDRQKLVNLLEDADAEPTAT